ncbi:pyruvate kinase [Limnothrix sp. FACHB-708]|uniref:pyruvate kinase n=1 Tax=unclassified Limnothrix TaxID=2632864 RepID=UPI00168322C6|nr:MULTISPECIES: pyruvate kinase [unclassified Limnothrix]MBD2554010.1 pyruvate kinase [Limnothrix sp. FACHB-708]MBD2592509.1 pyruvate kinase [Limnothrix sp. FACHB-406]
MKPLTHRTKIVATIGPASDSPEMIRKMLLAGMNVARLNFSHGHYDDHAERIWRLRQASEELDLPLMLLQDLQGPKIRVGDLPPEGIPLIEGEILTLVPIAEYQNQPNTVGIDYPHLAAEAEPGTQVLLDDGLLELSVQQIDGHAVHCQVIEGGILKSRKGVNFPSLDLQLPSITDKDKRDLEFGIAQGVDLISLSFVRKPEDVQVLKALLAAKGAEIPVLAKLEKPQAIANLQAIIDECDAVMVARGDLGVEMRPEKVPLIQKQIIRLCNQRGIPVITATQMLDSMIHNPRPTRAEASDVANAIMDGTDAVMLSGESAVGSYPIESVKMLARIATEVEPSIQFVNYPPNQNEDTDAISEALHAIDETIDLQCIVAFTETGYTAQLASAERPRTTIIAYTPDPKVYHRLSLSWGVRPILLKGFNGETLASALALVEQDLLARQYAAPGDKVLVMGGVPFGKAGSTNFLKIHTIAAD